MTYAHATDPGPRYQWEPWDSKTPNGSVNCNPSSTAYILDFYRDRIHNINALRRSVGVPDGKVMSTNQVSAVMAANGVPNFKQQLSLVTLKALLSSGRRPLLVGLWMGKIPAAVRDHSFLGMHGVVAMANAWRSGVSGILVMDPNFNPWIGRDDPDHGEKFYPDWLLTAAMRDYNTAKVSWAVIPSSPKVVAAPAPVPVPPPTTGYPRTLYFAKGTYTGRRFNSAGAIVESKAYTLTKASNAPASRRSLIKNQTGYWYFITAGVWAGYWIREGPGIT